MSWDGTSSLGSLPAALSEDTPGLSPVQPTARHCSHCIYFLLRKQRGWATLTIEEQQRLNVRITSMAEWSLDDGKWEQERYAFGLVISKLCPEIYFFFFFFFLSLTIRPQLDTENLKSSNSNWQHPVCKVLLAQKQFKACFMRRRQ